MTREHINPDRFADSAGVPWEGRKLAANPFAGDDGSARPELIQAIQDFHQSGDPAPVFIEFAKARILIPLVAHLGESGEGAHGQVVDKSADLSIVTVECPDGQTALPVFSSVAAMAAWNPSARPVPSDAVRAAIAAASEGNTRIVLDPTSDSEFVFRRPAIAALGQQLSWQTPHLNKALTELLREPAKNEPALADIRFTTRDPLSRLVGDELVVTLIVRPGLDQTQLQELLERVSKSWAELDDFGKLIDSVKIVVEPFRP
jgi:hypothetical protein